MKKILFAIIVLALSLTGCSKERASNETTPGHTQAPQGNGDTTQSATTAADAQASQLSPWEKGFIEKAGQGGNAEIELGKLAVQKASSPDVKKFAQRMIDDHGAAGKKLEGVANETSVSISTTLPDDAEQERQKLSGMSGKAFDKEYMRFMVKDHTQDVDDFQKATQAVQFADLKSFVNDTLPVIQGHLKQAQQIAGKTK